MCSRTHLPVLACATLGKQGQSPCSTPRSYSRMFHCTSKVLLIISSTIPYCEDHKCKLQLNKKEKRNQSTSIFALDLSSFPCPLNYQFLAVLRISVLSRNTCIRLSIYRVSRLRKRALWFQEISQRRPLILQQRRTIHVAFLNQRREQLTARVQLTLGTLLEV